MYLFAQIWLQEFPEYKTENKQVNIWGYSYSGLFAPATAAHIQQQNHRIHNGTTSDPKAKPIQLGTLGLDNACVDALTQAASYPQFAYNNTYGQFMDADLYTQAMHNLTMDGGCLDQIKTCRAAVVVGDPDGHGTNDTVNSACLQATDFCFSGIQGAFLQLEPARSPFDISLLLPAVSPPEYPAAFYNQRWVQEALGVPVNFTLSSSVIPRDFFARTGDPMRYDAKADLEFLLDTGVGLALVYGDRDYRCNWLGAQNLSLALKHPSAPGFRSAGYADITTNASNTGGLVRQHGNISFSRVFEAGHAVAAYQPETVYRIYQRTILGRDVKTGEVDVAEGYSTDGLKDTFGVRMALPESPGCVCYLYDVQGTCSGEEVEALQNGSAVVKDWVLMGVDAGERSGADGRRVPAVVRTAGAMGLGAVLMGL